MPSWPIFYFCLSLWYSTVQFNPPISNLVHGVALTTDYTVNQCSETNGRFDFRTEDTIPVFVRSHVKKPESDVFSVLFCPEAIRMIQGDTVVVQQR